MNNSKRRSIFRRTVRPLLALGLSASLLLSFAYTVFALYSQSQVEYTLAEFPTDFHPSVFAIQSNGDIVLARGAALTGLGAAADPALVFFHGDGSVNTSYASDGLVAIAQGGIAIISIAVQSDDKIILVTHNYDFFDEPDHLERYNPDGSPDTSFDASVAAPIKITAIAIQPDDKIVVAGSILQDNTLVFRLGRYNPDGSLDTSFDGDGWLTSNFPLEAGSFQSVAVLSNGKIVGVGTVAGDFAVVVFNPDGSLDTGFDEDGWLFTDFSGGDDIAHSVAVQSNDKIVVAGGSDQGSTAMDFALARYNPDGSLNTSFSGDGLLTTDFSSGDDYINS